MNNYNGGDLYDIASEQADDFDYSDEWREREQADAEWLMEQAEIVRDSLREDGVVV